MRTLLLILSCCLSFTAAKAQELTWAINSPSIIDATVDKAGNVYTVSLLDSSTFDYDPGPGVHNHSYYPTWDEVNFVVVKLDSNGSLVWTRQVGLYVNSRKYNIAVDGASNVYISAVANAFYFMSTSYNDAGQFIIKL